MNRATKRWDEKQTKVNQTKQLKNLTKIIVTIKFFSKPGFTLQFTCITYLALIMGYFYIVKNACMNIFVVFCF